VRQYARQHPAERRSGARFSRHREEGNCQAGSSDRGEEKANCGNKKTKFKTQLLQAAGGNATGMISDAIVEGLGARATAQGRVTDQGRQLSQPTISVDGRNVPVRRHARASARRSASKARDTIDVTIESMRAGETWNVPKEFAVRSKKGGGPAVSTSCLHVPKKSTGRSIERSQERRTRTRRIEKAVAAALAKNLARLSANNTHSMSRARPGSPHSRGNGSAPPPHARSNAPFAMPTQRSRRRLNAIDASNLRQRQLGSRDKETPPQEAFAEAAYR